MDNNDYVCAECGRSFHLSVGEIGFYQSRGLKTPRRCPACRILRRQPTHAKCIFCGNTFEILPNKLTSTTLLVCADCKIVLVEESRRINPGLYKINRNGKEENNESN